MYETIDELHNMVVHILNANPYVLPIKINSLVYDAVFTDRCGNGYYNKLFKELHDYADKALITFLCDSQDVKEEIEHGDYDYYYAFTDAGTPIIYLESSHRYAFPDKLIIYGSRFQIEVYSDKLDISVYEVNGRIRKIFDIGDSLEMQLDLLDMLCSTDREILFEREEE